MKALGYRASHRFGNKCIDRTVLMCVRSNSEQKKSLDSALTAGGGVIIIGSVAVADKIVKAVQRRYGTRSELESIFDLSRLLR